jgi:hypothetical protein
MGGTRVEAMVHLNKKNGHQGNVSSCVKNEDLIFPRQQYNYKEHEGKTIKTDRWKLLRDALKHNNNNNNNNNGPLFGLVV